MSFRDLGVWSRFLSDVSSEYQSPPPVYLRRASVKPPVRSVIGTVPRCWASAEGERGANPKRHRVERAPHPLPWIDADRPAHAIGEFPGDPRRLVDVAVEAERRLDTLEERPHFSRPDVRARGHLIAGGAVRRSVKGADEARSRRDRHLDSLKLSIQGLLLLPAP